MWSRGVQQWAETTWEASGRTGLQARAGTHVRRSRARRWTSCCATVRHSTDLGYIPIVVRDACGAGDEAAGWRALESLEFAGDPIIADTDEVCAALSAAR